MTKKYVLDKKISDSDISKYEGEYFDTDSLDIIIDEDADVYTSDNKLLFKLRKNVISKESCTSAIESFRVHSQQKHDNRGASAGPLNRDKLPRYVGTFLNPGKFRTGFYSNKTGKKSQTATSNLAQSNIAGYFDKPDRNLKGKGAPCRLTAFNRDYPELWNNALSFIKECDNQFRILVSDKYKNQKKRAKETKDFIINDTVFSTITLNYSWQTALHKDAGDFENGFGNLIVLEDHYNNNTYTGCYTCFPQYKVGINVRQGDFLAMDVHQWHCNTPLIPVNNKIYGKWKEVDIKNKWYLNRLSVVCYLRNNMIKCKDMKIN